MPLWLRLGAVAMFFVFLSWAGFQYNDPDGPVWMAVYGAAAVLTLLFLLRRLPRWLPWVLTAICVVWAAYLAARVIAGHEFFFDEQGREAMGLTVVALWSLFLARMIPKWQRAESPPAV